MVAVFCHSFITAAGASIATIATDAAPTEESSHAVRSLQDYLFSLQVCFFLFWELFRGLFVGFRILVVYGFLVSGFGCCLEDGIFYIWWG